MKYESNILKRLIDTYGVVGNPRYLSEIIKEFIVRGKELYPQLFTYQADWLAHIDEFGLTPEYVVSYTGQQIYAPHTKERPVKRAILKGCTGYRDIDTGEILETFEEGRNLELVSVRMPVLTTTGKNLFDATKHEFDLSTGKIVVSKLHTQTKMIEYKVEPNTQYTLTVNKINDGKYIRLNLENEYETFRSTTYSKKITSNSNGVLTLRLSANSSTDLGTELYNIQLEQGSVSTPYEPHKSNILTVNEDVVLRGIADVQDTLDCLTGEVIERVGEIVLDGSEDEGWKDWWNLTNTVGCYILNGIPNNGKAVVNNIPYNTINGGDESNDIEGYNLSTAGTLLVRILKSKLSSPDLNGFKEYLASNPIVIQYGLTQESIKTVDLTVKDQNDIEVSQLSSFNGGTHFSTSSQLGSLPPSISVDVVTDLEETLNLCSMDGNTL